MTRPAVHLFEEHSGTLPVWWRAAGATKTVVYLDAHLDLQKTSEDGISALKACDTLEEICSLETPSHLNPAKRFAFGIENFLYPAHQLGLLDRLVWVAPPHIPRRYSPALIEYMQQMDGISFEELTGFEELSEGVLRGTLLGLDITICDYDSLSTLDLPDDYLLDIDIDYFVDVPDDKLWIDPEHVIATIVEQLGWPQLVTISRAVSSGFTPVAFRFIGDYLEAYLSEQDSALEYYRGIYQTVQALASGHLEKGMRRCQELVDAEPELAAAPYLQALGESDADRKQASLEEAARRDPAYRFDLAREAIGLLHRRKALHRTTIEQLVNTYNSQPLTETERAEAQIALAQLLSAAGATEPAEQLLSFASGDLARHEDVLLSLARHSIKSATTETTVAIDSLLEEVAEGTKNATQATIYRGDLALQTKDYHRAIEFYTQAHDRAPAWLLPLQRLAECYQHVDQQQASQLTRQIEKRRARLQALSAAT